MIEMSILFTVVDMILSYRCNASDMVSISVGNNDSDIHCHSSLDHEIELQEK